MTNSTPTTLKDGPITLGAIYLLITAAGYLATYLWTWPQSGPACLALFAALVGLYAVGTGPGRRTGWRAYLLCGALVPAAVVLLAIVGAGMPYSGGEFFVFEVLSSGLDVGYRMESTAGLLMWMLEIGLVIQIGPMLRRLIAEFAAIQNSARQRDQ